METRYERPDDRLLIELVDAALDGRGGGRETRDVVESGSSNVVVLAGDVAVRVARDRAAAERLRGAQGLVDRLPELPFAVPRSVGPIIEHEGLAAVPVLRLSGGPHPHGHGDPKKLRFLLDTIHSIDFEPLRPWLAPPRLFCGGPDWFEVLTERVVPLLPPDVRDEATNRTHALASLRPPELALNHGDLAGSNILWHEGNVVGVLDWDLAAEEDPAEDTASLVGWHGWHLIEEVADSATAARALVFRRSFPLQIIAFSVLAARPHDEIQRTVQRALVGLRATGFSQARKS